MRVHKFMQLYLRDERHTSKRFGTICSAPIHSDFSFHPPQFWWIPNPRLTTEILTLETLTHPMSSLSGKQQPQSTHNVRSVWCANSLFFHQFALGIIVFRQRYIKKKQISVNSATTAYKTGRSTRTRELGMNPDL